MPDLSTTVDSIVLARYEELTDIKDDPNPLRADLLQSALARVDWLALADEVNRKAGETG